MRLWPLVDLKDGDCGHIDSWRTPLCPRPAGIHTMSSVEFYHTPRHTKICRFGFMYSSPCIYTTMSVAFVCYARIAFSVRASLNVIKRLFCRPCLQHRVCLAQNQIVTSNPSRIASVALVENGYSQKVASFARGIWEGGKFACWLFVWSVLGFLTCSVPKPVCRGGGWGVKRNKYGRLIEHYEPCGFANRVYRVG